MSDKEPLHEAQKGKNSTRSKRWRRSSKKTRRQPLADVFQGTQPRDETGSPDEPGMVSDEPQVRPFDLALPYNTAHGGGSITAGSTATGSGSIRQRHAGSQLASRLKSRTSSMLQGGYRQLQDSKTTGFEIPGTAHKRDPPSAAAIASSPATKQHGPGHQPASLLSPPAPDPPRYIRAQANDPPVASALDKAPAEGAASAVKLAVDVSSLQLSSPSPCQQQNSNLYVCLDCISRRSNPILLSCLEMLLKPIYCMLCKADRPLILFDEFNRSSHPESFHACVNHSAAISLCSHEQYSLDDLTDSVCEKDGVERTIVSKSTFCNSPNCELFNVSIRTSRASGKTQVWTVVKEWEEEFVEAEGNSLVPILKILRCSVYQQPALFCSHMAADIENFFSEQHLEECRVERSDSIFKMACTSCTAVLTVTPPIIEATSTKPVRKGRLKFRQEDRTDVTDLTDPAWPSMMCLNSAGLNRDALLENVTWCSDLRCETGRFRERLGVLLKNAQKWMKLKQQFDANGILFDVMAQLDHAVKQQRLGRQQQQKAAAKA